jgi:hypothetical protein
VKSSQLARTEQMRQGLSGLLGAYVTLPPTDAS